jgi:hypothetical protein
MERNRKLLVSQIAALSATEHSEIHKILLDNGIHLTHNANGAFVNLNAVSPHVLDRIGKFVDFCLAHKEALDDYDRRLSDAKVNNDCRLLMSDAADDKDDAAPSAALQQWDEVLQAVVRTPRQQQVLDKFTDVLNRAQALDNRMQRKTAINNKFTASKKKYTRRTLLSRNDPCDLPDQLERDDA